MILTTIVYSLIIYFKYSLFTLHTNLAEYQDLYGLCKVNSLLKTNKLEEESLFKTHYQLQ